MEALKSILIEHPFFEGFPQKDVEKIANYATLATFDPEQFIFKEGQQADNFYLLREGQVKLQIHIPNYGPVNIEKINAGDVVGWSWLYPPHKWLFDARASVITQSIVLNGKALRTIILNDHEFGYNLMSRLARIVGGRLQATRSKLIEFYKIFPNPDESRSEWEKLL